ncbi:hypothetical protein HNW13_017535 [Shewanella sp. BF02_Schw]|uniref:hypothetical protein n=1 Tax=Shewanella sp. BF02_Schw TaxID=394908 RepID=UPI00177ADD53|nr:hypothetical protein [Shewanella sp. BF02_Schw]MBO1897542.1 hypothetical protein [Shewanella sp. BF02_Schw]
MANSITKSCFTLPITEEQAYFAINVIDCAEHQSINFNKPYKTATSFVNCRTDVFKLAKKLVMSVGGYVQGEVRLGFEYVYIGGSFRIYHNETINLTNAAQFVHIILKHFESDEFVLINAAETCNIPVVGKFGGNAAFVTKKEVKWMSTHNWLQTQANRHNAKLTK